MKQEREKEKNVLGVLKEAIDGAETQIEAEFERTDNSWMDCFGSMVFAVELYSNTDELKGLITPEQHQTVLSNIEKLKKHFRNMREKYPSREKMPPEKIKQELISELDVLKEAD